jgi:iron(III) transport system substrate-binding protein
MKPILRRDALLALAASVSAAAVAPAARADEAALLDAARKEGPMTWYISFYAQDLPAQAAALFAKQYPGLTVTPVRLTTGGTFQRLFQDLRNNVAIASVVTATGIGGQYTVLLQGDKLARYTPQAAGQIRPGLKTATTPDFIYPMGAGLFALAYNTDKVSAADAPHAWTDLQDPKWKGKLALGDPSFSGFDAAWDVQMIKKYGWDFYVTLAKNDPLIQRSTVDSMGALIAGERLVSALPDELVLTQAAKGDPIGVIYPTDGSVEVLGLTAILANAPQPATARLFTEFLLGPQHAKLLVDNHLQSARSDVVAKLAGGKSLGDIVLAPQLPFSVYGDTMPDLVEKWRDLFSQ